MSCIKLVIAGSGAALHPRRGQASILLDLGGHTRLAVDYGCTAPQAGARAGINPWDIDYFIVTHGHYDHFCGVAYAGYLASFKVEEPTLRLAGSRSAYDTVFSTVSMLRGGSKVKVEYAGGGPGARLTINDALVRFIEARHTIEACSVAVEYSGLKILISGDTRPTTAYRDEAVTAAVAVHEATYPSSMAERALANGHSTVQEAVIQVSPANLGVLYHLTPESEAEAVKATGGAGGRVVIPEDGSSIRVC